MISVTSLCEFLFLRSIVRASVVVVFISFRSLSVLVYAFTFSPFSSVGVDYFGPILVKSRGSQVKRYECVFTCLAVRAVHIEIGHELTTDSFIQAVTRFVSRRGPPIEVYSDNGTYFKGGEAEINIALEKWNPDRIDNCLRKRGVKWNFNPPHASHAAGVWSGGYAQFAGFSVLSWDVSSWTMKLS